MSDIIQLLPDSVANQIAAGEVIQRPASVVKELLENAVDAGASSVQVIVKDSGRTLIRVIDNGCGMSEIDARLSFEKHATSKIRKAEDLFAIRTKGFRGEALASIASVAQVELKTRLVDEELGTHIAIEGSEVKSQEPCQTPEGTSFSVKNLFFNIPARRQFLKSDNVEMRHIIDEFERVALSHPSIAFKLNSNNAEIFNLTANGLRQRVVGVFGSKHNQRLVPLEETTEIVDVSGFIGKPEFARKSRGEQFIFVNDRFIKSHYLNHAVNGAYESLLPKGMHPLFVLYLNVDPAEIDVNIHPTKTEIKFRDERNVYAVVHAAVKQALGKFNISPSLDFDQETSIRINPLAKDHEIKQPQIKINPDYNPFAGESKGSPGLVGRYQKESPAGWEKLYEIAASPEQTKTDTSEQEMPEESHSVVPVFQLDGTYIITRIKSGLVAINRKRATERILYEENMVKIKAGKGASQQLLFPETVTLSPASHALFMSRLEEIQALGFEVEDFGASTLKVNGLPVECAGGNAEHFIQDFIEQIKHFKDQLDAEPLNRLAMALARSVTRRHSKHLTEEEMRNLLDRLFACEGPYYDPTGKPTIATFTHEEIQKKFA